MTKEQTFEAQLIEAQTQKEINESVSMAQNIIVKAGAGSGKTYSLIKLLKNLMEKNNEIFSYTNQKIMCITYTNAAADEIKKRLGETDLVSVSTIHERIWDMIKLYQVELKKIHFKKIQVEYKKIKENLSKNNFYKNHKDSEKLNEYFEFITNRRGYFYDVINQTKATELHMKVKDYFNEKQLKNNSGKFKEMSRDYLKYEKYKQFIENKNKNMKNNIEYNFLMDRDNLLRLEIGHDTVLEYGLELIQLNPIFKKMIIDRFPYAIVDEYQDTASIVLEFLFKLDDYAKVKGYSFTIALFGDELQSIYSNQNSSTVSEYLGSKSFKIIEKKFNYRSTTEIINISNRIREDGIIQTSPYESFYSSMPTYKKIDSENFSTSLESLKNKWNISSENKLTCLFLRNNDIAKYLEIEKLYNKIASMSRYSGLNYSLVSQETLNKDITKLGEAQRTILSFLSLYIKINNSEIYLTDIFPDAMLKKMTIAKVNKYITDLRDAFSSQLNTFDDYLNIFYNFFEDYDNNLTEEIYPKYNKHNLSTKGEFKDFIREIFKEEEEEFIKIDELLNIDIREYINLYNYLYTEKNQDEIEFITYHSSKGLEYDNVLVIMTNDMAGSREYFSYYLKNIQEKNLLTEKEFNEKYKIPRNVFYVAVTRAIRNLQAWYMDELEPVKNSLDYIFLNVGDTK